MNNENKYDDIINLPHHTSATHPRMAMIDRAAQFSPFAALTGHGAALDETARLTDAFIELDECEKAVINEKLQMISDFISEAPEISVIYFEPDSKKSGGAYVTVTGTVKKIDSYGHQIIMTDGKHISVEQIYELQVGAFDYAVNIAD